MKKAVYIAGPITGCERYAEYFGAAAEAIRDAGHIPLNPAALPKGLEYESYMDIGYAMLQCADAIVMLPGWRESRGANREYGVALGQELNIIFAGECTTPNEIYNVLLIHMEDL